MSELIRSAKQNYAMPSPSEEPASEKLLKVATYLLTAPLGRAAVGVFAGITGGMFWLLPKVPIWLLSPLAALLCIIVCLWLLCFPVILARAKKKGELASLANIARISEHEEFRLKMNDAARLLTEQYTYVFRAIDGMFGVKKK